MTAQEALRYIKYATSLKLDFNGQGQIVGDDTIEELRQVIISALEKQTPKKPKKDVWVDDEKRKGEVRLARENDILTKDNHTTINLCPNCDEWVTVQKYLSPPKYDLYCRNCGQAIDWSDTE